MFMIQKKPYNISAIFNAGHLSYVLNSNWKSCHPFGVIETKIQHSIIVSPLQGDLLTLKGRYGYNDSKALSKTPKARPANHSDGGDRFVISWLHLLKA